MSLHILSAFVQTVEVGKFWVRVWVWVLNRSHSEQWIKNHQFSVWPFSDSLIPSRILKCLSGYELPLWVIEGGKRLWLLPFLPTVLRSTLWSSPKFSSFCPQPPIQLSKSPITTCTSCLKKPAFSILICAGWTARCSVPIPAHASYDLCIDTVDALTNTPIHWGQRSVGFEGDFMCFPSATSLDKMKQNQSKPYRSKHCLDQFVRSALEWETHTKHHCCSFVAQLLWQRAHLLAQIGNPAPPSPLGPKNGERFACMKAGVYRAWLRSQHS